MVQWEYGGIPCGARRKSTHAAAVRAEHGKAFLPFESGGSTDAKKQRAMGVKEEAGGTT